MPKNEIKRKSAHYRAFVRDSFCCVYCGKSILESFDSFASAHLDRLKPVSSLGQDDEVFNRVTACGDCNSRKEAYDPVPGEALSEENYETALTRAKDYIQRTRLGLSSTNC